MVRVMKWMHLVGLHELRTLNRGGHVETDTVLSVSTVRESRKQRLGCMLQGESQSPQQ